MLARNDTNPHCQKNHAHDKRQHRWFHGVGTVWIWETFFTWHSHNRTGVLIAVPGGRRAPHNRVRIPSQLTELGIERIVEQQLDPWAADCSARKISQPIKQQQRNYFRIIMHIKSFNHQFPSNAITRDSRAECKKDSTRVKWRPVCCCDVNGLDVDAVVNDGWMEDERGKTIASMLSQ